MRGTNARLEASTSYASQRGLRRRVGALSNARQGGHGRRLDRGRGAALRRLLWIGHIVVPGRRARRADPQTQVPLIGDANGVWSFLHIEDAAEATLAAVERGRRGISIIVDDDPAAVGRK